MSGLQGQNIRHPWFMCVGVHTAHVITQVIQNNGLDLTSSEDLTQLDVQNNTLYCLVLPIGLDLSRC
jgi:heme/copper-type cytochrome/quinol oxidase subunit 3